MGNKEDLKAEAEKEGFDFTNQAIKLLSGLEKPMDSAKQLIKLAKDRKFKIAGGDVVRFIIKGDTPTVLTTSDDTDNLYGILSNIEKKLDKLLEVK